MRTLDQALAELVAQRPITRETALAYARSPEELERLLPAARSMQLELPATRAHCAGARAAARRAQRARARRAAATRRRRAPSRFAVYLTTLAPTVMWYDMGEFATASATLGIAHNTGYPLLILLGKAFTFLPVGDTAYRVNLMSAVFTALAVALVFGIIHDLTDDPIGSAAWAR